MGLELLDNGALAVSVDESGRVVARGQSTGEDLAAAAMAALEKVSPTPAAPAVAAINPESRACVAALKALAERFRGSFLHELPVPSGIAAVTAEAWVGAASGATEVVFFAAGDHTSAGILRHGAPMTGATHRAPVIEIGRRLPDPMRQALTIVPASLGEDAPAVNAARLAAAAVA